MVTRVSRKQDVGGLRYLRMWEVMAKTGLARRTIEDMVQAGAFPAPFKLTPGTPERKDKLGRSHNTTPIGFDADAVEAWMKKRQRKPLGAQFDEMEREAQANKNG